MPGTDPGEQQKPYTTPKDFKAPSLAEQWAYVRAWPPVQLHNTQIADGFSVQANKRFPIARYGLPAAISVGLIAWLVSPSKAAEQ